MSTMSTEQLQKMTEFRTEIDHLDNQIIKLLGDRFQVCRRVADFKKQQSIPMMQPARVAAIKERCRTQAIEHQINPDFLVNLYSLIIDQSCQLEDQIIHNQQR